jgi:putative DNA primase/helicase
MTETLPPRHTNSVAELKQLAKGQWANIFDDLFDGPENPNPLSEAFAANGFHVACPVHGGSDGFRLFGDFLDTGGTVCNSCGPHKDGFSTLAWLLEKECGAGAFKETIRRVANWLRVDHSQRVRPERKALEFKPIVDPAKAAAKIREVWRGSLPLADSAAEKYLRSRGIPKMHLPTSLRFHPGLQYWDAKQKKSLGVFPCLLAPIKNKENKIVSIHRIFLTDEGAKASVPDPKKMMAMCDDIRGGAIRLQEAVGDTLGVAEGIETALAAQLISQMPVWSCVSAPLLELVEIPDHVKTVVIWADKDRSLRGDQAANKLADRVEKMGKRALICIPTQEIPESAKGLDWLDVLINYGMSGFPAMWRRWRPAVPH